MVDIVLSALRDIKSTLILRRVWVALAAEDISDEHKRTTLGPVWLLINYLAFVGTFCFVIFAGNADPNFIPYVAVGLLVWFYMSDIIISATGLFSKEENFIKGTSLPISLYAMKLFMQVSIRTVYSLLGCALIVLIAGKHLGYGWTLSLIPVFLILFMSPAIIIVFAFLGAFFPDAKFLIQNAMRVGMFLTPVFWTYEGSGGVRHIFYWYNPFTYFLDMVRSPIIDGNLPISSILFCSFICIVMWCGAIFLLGKFRKEVVFVL